VEVQLHTFLTLALDEGEWPASYSGHSTPKGKKPFYLLDRRPSGSWSKSGHGGKEKKIPSLPLPGIKTWSTYP